jgi:DNA-binding SARP family transcriptional activator
MIQINVFGPTVVTNDELRLGATELGGVKPRQLLEMLALDLGTPVSKDLLAERLWEGHPPTSYIATVESYVCVLRGRARLGHGRHAALATTTSGYVLDPDQVAVDLVEARTLLASATVPEVVQALDMISGELLAGDPYASWACEGRAEFADRLVEGCISAAHSANAVGESVLALRLARAAYDRSYLSEPAAQALMIALASTGERGQALRIYEGLRSGMVEELGVEPSVETTGAYLSTLRDTPRDGDAYGAEQVGTLLRLLRRALEVETDRVPHEPEMAEVGRLLLARCG